MDDLFRGLAIAVLLPLAVLFLQMAWKLLTMPEWQRRELEERRQRRLHDQRMIRFWLSSGRSR